MLCRRPKLRPILATWAILLLSISALSRAATPGTVDTSFNPAGSSGGRVLTGLSGGKVLVSGSSLIVGAPVSTFRGIARFNNDGTVDTGFDGSAFSLGTVEGHAIRSDGRVVVYGGFSKVSGHSTRGVALLNDNGSVDTSFQVVAGWSETAHLVVPLPDGNCLVGYRGGQFVRIGPTGVIDPAFTPNPALKQVSFGFAVQPSGKVLVLQAGRVFRLDTNGTLDPTYAEVTFPGLGQEYGFYVPTPDGGLYISSNTSSFNGGDLRTVVRLLPNGGADPAFRFVNDGTSSGSRQPSFLRRDGLGRLYLTGVGFPLSGLQRYLPSGAADGTFTNYCNPIAFGFDPAGQVLASGTYVQISPVVVVKSGLMRLYNDDTPPPPAKPSFYAAPAPLTVDSGDPATFTAGASGDAPLSYRWFFGATEVANGPMANLLIESARAANMGDYSVIVSNPYGSITSAPVALVVRTAPKIPVDPVGFTAPEGTDTNLVAVVRGEPPLSLQWYRNEQPIPDATEPTFHFASLKSSNAGGYALVVANASGSVTSKVAQVRVLASKPQWLTVTNATTATTFADAANPFRPDTALRVAHDGIRGTVVLYNRGLERWNDAGERLWTIRYEEADFGTLGNLVLDTNGNAYVSGMLHFTGRLGDLAMTNNSSVTGPNGHVQAFIAKIDPEGHGLWYRLYEAAGPRIGGLAVDTDGGVLFAGGSGGRNGLSRLGSLVASESEYASAVAGKIGTNGIPVWFRSFPQFAVNRSTCEADSIAADDTGVYITGLMSFSLQFGNFQLQNPSPNPLNWIGKLDSAGDPKWIRAAGGQPAQGAPIAAAGGRRWFLLPRDRVVQSWSPDGGLLTSVNAVVSSQNDSALVNQIGVTAKGELMLIGNSNGRVNVGGTELNPGTTRPQVWFGQWDADGKLIRARTLATTTNANPQFGADTVAITAFAAGVSGEAVLAGNFVYAMRFLGKDIVAPAGSVRPDGRPGGAFLAKAGLPALTPEITQQPIAAYTLDVGGTVKIGINASGPGPLTYQWRHDGNPLDGSDTNALALTSVTMSAAGRYDVVVSNPYGSVVSDVSVITVRPPFNIRTQPAPQLVLLDGAVLAGDAIDSLAIQSGAVANKQLSLTVTNSTSARFPVGGKLVLQFNGVAAGGSYAVLNGGIFPARNDTFATVFSIPDITNLRLLRLNGTDLATLGLQLGGRFDLHFDIAAADGCCATGTFTESGGPAKATFQVVTTTFVPAGNYQWRKDGKDLPGQTAASLQLNNVTANDAGLYTCVIAYNGYSETTLPAELRVLGAGVPPASPVLEFQPFQPGATGLTIPTWPAGYVLQRTTSLSPAVWETYAVSGPVTIPFSAPGEYFRLAPAP